MKKNLTAAHLSVAAVPIVPSWHACVTHAAAVSVLAGAAQRVDVLTRGTGNAGAFKVVGDKRTTTRMVGPAPSSPPV